MKNYIGQLFIRQVWSMGAWDMGAMITFDFWSPQIHCILFFLFMNFVYVGKIPSLRQVLLNSKLHFSLVTLAETFSISRTDFRRSDGSRKTREPRDPTDMLKPQTTPTNLFYFPTYFQKELMKRIAGGSQTHIILHVNVGLIQCGSNSWLV